MTDRLVGTVDGQVDGELQGWLANLDDPSTCEPIIFRSNNGRQRVFRTFQYREDVCSALSALGRFGFSIPTHQLVDLGDAFSVYDRNGTLLKGGLRLTLERGSDAPDLATPTFFYIHIPKTAGTSLRNTLAGLLPNGETLMIYPGSEVGISLQEFHQMPMFQRRQFRFVMGHFHYGLHAFTTRPARYITFLRDVRSRLSSNVRHHAAAGTKFVFGGKTIRPSVVINEGLTEEFDNIVTRTIAGISTDMVPVGKMSINEVDIALKNIGQDFAFVGKHENAERDCAALADFFGIAAPALSFDNRTPDRNLYPARELDSIDWNGLMERNKVDAFLYSYLENNNLFSRVLRPA